MDVCYEDTHEQLVVHLVVLTFSVNCLIERCLHRINFKGMVSVLDECIPFLKDKFDISENIRITFLMREIKSTTVYIARAKRQ